jgi:hypothetical protein
VGDFDKAQSLFGSFQKNEQFHNLRDSLDILDNLIEIQGAEFQRALRLKENIKRYIDSKIQGFYHKTNIGEYSKKRLTADQATVLFIQALTQEDLGKYVALMEIKEDYFE